MKKIIAFIVVLFLLFTMTNSIAEGVVILSSPDMNTTEDAGSLDDMKLGVEIDMGDRKYKPVKFDIFDKKWPFDSGKDAELLVLWIDVLNLTQKDQKYFTDAKVIVTYESVRGTYQFGGSARNCYNSGGEGNYNQEESREIKPLYYGYYLFACAVPNFVIENPGELKMEITTGTTMLTYYIRK